MAIIATILFRTLEKAYGEYQLAPGACNEKRQVHFGHQVNVEVTTTGQSKVDHTCQQCTTPEVRSISVSCARLLNEAEET